MNVIASNWDSDDVCCSSVAMTTIWAVQAAEAAIGTKQAIGGSCGVAVHAPGLV